MAGMDGPEVLAALKADSATRGIPVVFFTGDSKGVAADRWRALGASGAVAKPFDFPLLPAQFASNKERKLRFEREARAVGAVGA